MRSVQSRDNFLKLTVDTEEEHMHLKTALINMKAEFKCFNLRKDRPIKVVIRGLPSCTNHEPIIETIKAYGFNILKFSQLSKFGSKQPMPLSTFKWLTA
ncbi:hypothetical protein CEXT_682811 [Caerostris extrusa]|uniref:Uncharacterized protein n=1 Tax=Caerostris extrusa TaxID=172846 RepID=A0AAV4R1Q3_CAEEX|nr:hypothetical protein CEXT_682811 [Caerostris extrusa]